MRGQLSNLDTLAEEFKLSFRNTVAVSSTQTS